MSAELPSFKTVINNLCLPSLEDLSILSVVTYLLEQENVIKIFTEHFSAQRPSSSLPNGRISKILKACNSVQIPDVLQSKFLNAIYWVLDHYVEWIFKFIDNEELESRFIKKDYAKHIATAVKWDLNITVHYQASLHQLLKNVNVQDKNYALFKIACEYCSEDDVRMYWSKLSAYQKEIFFKNRKKSAKCGLQLYWACMMNGEMEKFLIFFSSYVNSKGGIYQVLVDSRSDILSHANDCGFIMAVLVGSSVAVKYFSKNLTCINDQCLFHLIENFLGRIECDKSRKNEDADLLYFLLNKISDEELQSKIFDKFFKIFLRLGINYWPCHKFIVALVKMNADKLDTILFCNIITDLLVNVQKQKADVVLLKNLWRNISVELKKSFFLFICVKPEKLSVREFWENVTIDILDLFWKEEEFNKVGSLHENIGLNKLILAQKFDVVDHWLQNILQSKQTIITFMEEHVITKLCLIINGNSIDQVNKFIDWAFKYEDAMNKEKVLRVRDEVAEQACVKAFMNNMKSHNRWNDLNKFIDWLIKNRSDYDDTLINIKKQLFDNGKIMFQGKDLYTVHHFKKFLSYGIQDNDKVKNMINSIDFNENNNCLKWLLKGDWNSVLLLFDFLSEYGRDIFEMKKSIFNLIFTTEKASFFWEKEFSKNVDHVLFWSLKRGPGIEPDKKEVWEIKKTVFENLAPKSVANLIEKSQKVQNAIVLGIVNYLFKERCEDENYPTIIEKFKKAVIGELIKIDSVWEKKNHLMIMIELINWEKDDEKIKKGLWSLKKYFLEMFKNYVGVKVIPELIVGKEKNFIPLIFEGHEDEIDFLEILRDFKEFMLEELVNISETNITCLVFEKFNDFNEFLYWHDFDEIKLLEIKNLILEKKGIHCCLNWMLKDKFEEIRRFLDWCIVLSLDMESKIVKLKKDLLKEFFCKNSKYWLPKYFQLLDKFLLEHYSDAQKDLKKSAIEEFAAKGCCQRFLEGDLEKIMHFTEWADNGDQDFFDNLKENILKEIINTENTDYWKEEPRLRYTKINNFIKTSNSFLYGLWDFDSFEICNMKLNLVEAHFNDIFTKLLFTGDPRRLSNFLTWTFDYHLQSDEFRQRIKKLTKEIFDNYGKEYCKLLLSKYSSESLAEFWKICFDRQTNDKNLKATLWDFKKDCITETLITVMNETDRFGISSDWFWHCINKFISLTPNPPKFQNEVCEFKKTIKERYGIDLIKKCLQDELDNRFANPTQFLKWLFGAKNQNGKTTLDSKTLFDFKKEILENLLVIENKTYFSRPNFYSYLAKILDFNATDEDSIKNLKKSVAEVQGVNLCTGLICQKDEAALQQFLNWVISLYESKGVDFKRAVPTELAKNSKLNFSWESLKFVLVCGFDLNNEQDYWNYSLLKNHVLESCAVDICYNWTVKKQEADVREFLKWGFKPEENQKLIEFKKELGEKLQGNLMEFEDSV